MNTQECAEFTGIPAEFLHRVRTRNCTTTLFGGPPFSKRIDRNGQPKIVYNKAQVSAWMRKRNLLVTAAEAASILNIEREEILNIQGPKRFDLKHGFLVVNPGKNQFVLVLRRKRELSNRKRAS